MEIKSRHFSDTQNSRLSNGNTKGYSLNIEKMLPNKTEDEMVGWHHRLNGHEFK